MSTFHDINLNIHYTAPEDVWNQIDKVYQSMPYWAGYVDGPTWLGPDINISVSLEPSGLQFTGDMPDEIWETWYQDLKDKLTKELGYEIGEPEDGCDFRYWN